jgi:hypothetical protein
MLAVHLINIFYCLMGDGELDEGPNWEAAMLAGKEKLHNLTLQLLIEIIFKLMVLLKISCRLNLCGQNGKRLAGM